MTADDVRRAADAGMEIGSHGLTHRRLPEADDERWPTRCGRSREILAEIIGGTVDGFCYPYGGVGEREVAAVRAAGYDYACAVDAPPLAGRHALAARLHRRPGHARRACSPSGARHRLRTGQVPPMRVLHVITGLGAGGAEQQLRLLLRRLPHECEVVTLTNPGPVADGDPRRRDPGARPGCAATATCRRCPRLAPADPRRPLRPGAHPPLPRLRVRPDRRPAGRRPARRGHRALPRRRASSRAAATTAAVRGALPGGRAARAGPRSRCPQAVARPAASPGACRPDRITVIPNGIDPAEFALRPGAAPRRPGPALGHPAGRAWSSAASAGWSRPSASTS